MILELLNREPGVQRARQIGRGREPDQGRDILAEWYRPHKSSKENPLRLDRVVVQCKSGAAAANKGEVRDIVDVLTFHRSTGYLLVARAGVTKPLIDFLERLSERPEH
jgi:hypothetical protein